MFMLATKYRVNLFKLLQHSSVVNRLCPWPQTDDIFFRLPTSREMFFALGGIQLKHSKRVSGCKSDRRVDFDDGGAARYERRRNGANVFISDRRKSKREISLGEGF
jgi:hypothetical protein